MPNKITMMSGTVKVVRDLCEERSGPANNTDSNMVGEEVQLIARLSPNTPIGFFDKDTKELLALGKTPSSYDVFLVKGVDSNVNRIRNSGNNLGNMCMGTKDYENDKFIFGDDIFSAEELGLTNV